MAQEVNVKPMTKISTQCGAADHSLSYNLLTSLSYQSIVSLTFVNLPRGGQEDSVCLCLGGFMK